MVDITDEELNAIEQIISKAIEINTIINGQDLCKYIREKIPNIIEKNSYLTEVGLRKTINILLDDKFNFNGNVIAAYNDDTNSSTLLNNYLNSKESFNISELENFIQGLNIMIPWDKLYKNFIRLNETDFIRQDDNLFGDIDLVDSFLDRCIQRDYISFNELPPYTTFPNIKYMWNEFLLESFISCYSTKYKLLHKSYTKTGVFGAIVKRTAKHIQSFDDLIIHVLADSLELSSQMECQIFLREMNYTVRADLSNIEEIMIKVRELRNSRENI